MESPSAVIGPGTPGVDIFKLANASISGLVASYKTGVPRMVRLPFMSTPEEHLALYLEATLFERTAVITLLHTGIRAMEFAQLKASDLVQIGGVWKLHIHSGKGLKDRLIPLTAQCLTVLQTWQGQGWERGSRSLVYHSWSPMANQWCCHRGRPQDWSQSRSPRSDSSSFSTFVRRCPVELRYSGIGPPKADGTCDTRYDPRICSHP
jgi:hypothetical protein